MGRSAGLATVVALALLTACTSSVDPSPTTSADGSPTSAESGAFGSGLNGIPGLTVEEIDTRAAAAASGFRRSDLSTYDVDTKSYTWSANGSDDDQVQVDYSFTSDSEVLRVSCDDQSSVADSAVLDTCLTLPVTDSDQAATRAWFEANRATEYGEVRCDSGLAWLVANVQGITSVTVEVANPRNDREGKCAQVSP